MHFHSYILATLATGCGLVQATQLFANKGTLEGWDNTLKEHHGTVEQVDNIFDTGHTAIKVTQTYDEDYHGRYHSEFHHADGYRLGQKRFYGFSFRLPKDWQFAPAQSYNIAQFIAPFNNGCDDWMPSTMIWLVGDRLYSRLRTGSVCHQKTNVFSADGVTVTAGEWHRVVIQSHWESDDKGLFKLWYDGGLVFEKEGTATTVSDDAQFGFQVGLYANGWHDDKRMRGTQNVRELWYDEITVGTTFDDAV